MLGALPALRYGFMRKARPIGRFGQVHDMSPIARFTSARAGKGANRHKGVVPLCGSPLRVRGRGTPA